MVTIINAYLLTLSCKESGGFLVKVLIEVGKINNNCVASWVGVIQIKYDCF